MFCLEIPIELLQNYRFNSFMLRVMNNNRYLYWYECLWKSFQNFTRLLSFLLGMHSKCSLNLFYGGIVAAWMILGRSMNDIEPIRDAWITLWSKKLRCLQHKYVYVSRSLVQFSYRIRSVEVNFSTITKLTREKQKCANTMW